LLNKKAAEASRRLQDEKSSGAMRIDEDGDAMGMNMVSKGVQNVLNFLQNEFPDMDVISVLEIFVCSNQDQSNSSH
jgi:hypothetical protein